MKKIFVAILFCATLMTQASAASALAGAGQPVSSEDPLIESILNTTLQVPTNACSVSQAEGRAKVYLTSLCGVGYHVEDVVCDPCTVAPNLGCSGGQGVQCTCTGRCVRNPPPTPEPQATPKPKTPSPKSADVSQDIGG